MKEKLTIKDILTLLIGMFIVSIAVYYIMMPSKLVVGTISGLVIVLTNFVPLQASTLTFLLNVFLLILGFIFIGKEFGSKTVIASLLLPVYLRIFEIVTPNPPELTEDLLMNTLCFVLVISLGQAILFNINASSGGLDIVGKLMNKYLHIDIGTSLAISGFVIAATSILVYDRQILIHSLLGTYLGGVVLDHFLDGFRIRKKLSIISPKYPEIKDFVVTQLHRGVTLYHVHGGWDNQERVELVTILQKNEYAQVLAFISKVDPHAFVTVSTTGEVIGEWNPHNRNIKF